ncbi:MAG: DUF167 domain-containing protein [Alphaproteobacteria bacterium]|nr:DUF167 domain-containing protein [Alphaproteobacteria bacterium]
MFYEDTKQGIIIRVRLTPNSSCCKVTGLFQTPDGTTFLKVNIISVPEKGKANKELISWISKQLKIAKSDLSIISGELDRYKKILITADKESVLPQIISWIAKE